MAAIALILSTVRASGPTDALIEQARTLTESAMKVRLRASRGRFSWGRQVVAAAAHIFTGRRRYPPAHVSAPQPYPPGDILRAFESRGWDQVPHYGADGPNGTIFAYRKDPVTCVCELSWSPGHEDRPGESAEEAARRENVARLYRLKESCFAE